MKTFSVVGRGVPKLDAIDKATGRARYIQDVTLPGMLFGKILYSEHAHADILNIDTSQAEKIPGVKVVLTGRDVPPGMKMGFYKDNPPIKSGKVRSIRDEVAAVAAVSPEVAAEALGRIRVEYRPLPGVFDPVEAMKDDAPLIHEEAKSNVLKLPWKLHYGDVDAAAEKAAFCVEDSFSTTWVTHCCLGTSGAVAEFDFSNNLSIWTNTQIPSLAHKDFSEALKEMGLSGKKIRVVKPCIGGGFGSKLDTYAYEHIAILLAFHARRPVKILFNRKEEFTATSARQPTLTKIRQGCDADGKLLFRDMSMILDNGAYTSWGATTPTVMMMPITSLYRVENVRYKAKCVYTNNTYAQAMRGYGNPQATFAIESSMDMLAEAAGIDPLEFRRINQNESGDVTPQGLEISSCGMGRCMEEMAEKLGWDQPREKGVGVGMASLIHVGGGARIYKSDGCGTILKMDDYGKVSVFTGATDMGQGADNIVAQIVAEELGVLLEDVSVIHTDTDVCPWDVGAHASRTTFVAGNSALGAARKIKERLVEYAAGLLDADPGDIEIRERRVFAVNDPEKSVGIGKLLRKAHFSKNGQMLMSEFFYDPENENMGKDFKGNMSMTYAFGVHGVRVKVDEETGKVKILDYVAAHDVGKAINPMLLDGQVYGGVMMGAGYALTEELIMKDGEFANPNFRDYKILTAKDVFPAKAPVIETLDPHGPYGAKGIGEPGCVPSAPAIANAVYNAVGARVKSLPITPEKALAGIQRQKNQDSESRETEP
ncbi:Aerobic-type carbon monoxide dehydrogenase, large subunit CoxL/CutL-like protein [Candidatus Desulfarcum epimagneticum]|uniref:Aerobic-type carbon monoxide dehydrogenase, large subunit CoxL/CutL-like protein n=1 Tax=uncultured Desulfobacteraceae bacterium TaxID=218296 RepID=A0A484HG64_9BACT|nr:Aerobic-type carbon monoxide dehydrogenase, large subunit CoxL/CutL-like protein [uncultured Desulfobacteraceae bacterium]